MQPLIWRAVGVLVGVGLMFAAGVSWLLVRFWNQGNQYAPLLIVLLVMAALVSAAAVSVGPGRALRSSSPHRDAGLFSGRESNEGVWSAASRQDSLNLRRLHEFLRRLAELDASQWAKAVSVWRFEGKPAYRALWFHLLRFILRKRGGKESPALRAEVMSAIFTNARRMGVGPTEIAAAIDASHAVSNAESMTPRDVTLFYAPFQELIPFSSLKDADGESSTSSP